MVAVVARIAMRSEKQIHFAALDGRWIGVDESYPSHLKVTPVDGTVAISMYGVFDLILSNKVKHKKHARRNGIYIEFP